MKNRAFHSEKEKTNKQEEVEEEQGLLSLLPNSSLNYQNHPFRS